MVDTFARRQQWVRCPLVNPLCPDDLCQEQAGHPGSERGEHLLGTMPYRRLVSDVMFLTKRRTSDAVLVHLGRKAQDSLTLG